MLIGFFFLVAWLAVIFVGSLVTVGYLIKNRSRPEVYGGSAQRTALWLLSLVAMLGSALLLYGMFGPV